MNDFGKMLDRSKDKSPKYTKNPLDHYIETKKLSKGSYAMVGRVYDTIKSKTYAMKTLTLKCIASKIRHEFLSLN